MSLLYLRIVQENCHFVKKKELRKGSYQYRSVQTAGRVVDLSTDHVRFFEFLPPKGTVYVAWDADAEKEAHVTDLSTALGNREVIVTPIATQLNLASSPVVPEAKTLPATAVSLRIAQVFIE